MKTPFKVLATEAIVVGIACGSVVSRVDDLTKRFITLKDLVDVHEQK